MVATLCPFAGRREGLAGHGSTGAPRIAVRFLLRACAVNVCRDPARGLIGWGSRPTLWCMSESYDEGIERLRALVADFPSGRRVTWARMFNGDGIKLDDAFIAFIGSKGDLVAKVDAAQVEQMIASGNGAPVTMGKRTMREWVRVGYTLEDELWSSTLSDAYEFAAAAHSRS